MSKITAYNPFVTVSPGDLLIGVDIDDLSMAPTGTDKKLTLAQAYSGGTGIPVLTPSGDASGTTDTTNRTNAVATLGAAGGTILLAPGTFYWTCGTGPISQPGIMLQGSGRDSTIINAVGTGDCVRMYSTQSYGNGWGGGIRDLVIDGTSAGAGSAGAHIGDIYRLEFDFGVRNFTGAGSKGIWFDNQYWYAEQMTGQVWAEKCASHVVFDNSANIGGNSTGSFDRACLDIFLDMKGTGPGVTFQGGAILIDGRLGIYGNTDYGGALYYVLTLTGSGTSGFSRIAQSVLNIGVECNNTTGTQPGTINFGNVAILSNCIQGCTGIIDFSANNPFVLNSTNWTSNFQFDGPAYGDANLKGSGPLGHTPYNHGAIGNNGIIETRYNAVARVNPAGNVTGMILASNVSLNYVDFTVINESAFTLTFDVAATSNVADGVSDVIAATKAAKYTWDATNSLWYRTA